MHYEAALRTKVVNDPITIRARELPERANLEDLGMSVDVWLVVVAPVAAAVHDIETSEGKPSGD